MVNRKLEGERFRGTGRLSSLFAAIVVLLMLGSALPSGAAPMPAIKWGEPTILQDYGDSSSFNANADIVTDAHGNAYLTWLDWRKNYGAPYARSRLTDGTWTLARNVDSAGWDAQNEVIPRIAADGSGNVYVAWIDIVGSGNDRVTIVKSPDGGRNWTDNVDVSGSTAVNYEVLDVAAGHGSTVLLLMGTPSTLWLRASSNSGTTFAPAVEVKSALPPNYIDLPVLISTSSGETYLVYRLRGETDWAMQVMASTDDGQTFRDPVNVSTTFVPSPSIFHVPVATAAPGGRVAVAYLDGTYSGGEQRYKVTRSLDGGATWSQPALVDPQSEGGKANDADCFIAFAPDGTLYVVYYHTDDRDALSSYDPYLRTLGPDGTWTDRLDLNVLPLYGGYGTPRGLSVDGTGRLHLLFSGKTYSLEVDNTLHILGTRASSGDGDGGGGDGDEAKVTDFALFWAVLALMLVFLLLAVIGFARRPKQPAAGPAPAAYQPAPQPYYPQPAPPPPAPPPTSPPPPMQPPPPQR